MKLTVFPSTDGDCLLITGADGKMVLADGGRSGSYSSFAAETLETLLPNEKKFEAVYISHIDADHVTGIEKMLGDLISWTGYDFRKNQPDSANLNEPRVPRPPRPKKFWHNSFHDQVDENAGEIVDLLAASASVLSKLANAAPSKYWLVANEYSNLAASTKQALNISNRIGSKMLDIELNPEFDHKLMVLSDDGPKTIKVGRMKWHIIGPEEEHLKELREDWNKWLTSAKGKRQLKELENEGVQDKKNLGTAATEVSSLIAYRSLEATSLADSLIESSAGRDGVTTPNLASLMFLVEEGRGANRKTILMSGDGHWRDILGGLEKQKLFDSDQNLHVDVLKIPHHGASGNMDPEFLRRVTADHYVFCGISNTHHNPEKQVVEQVLDSRLKQAKKGTHAKVDDKFKLWFNGSSSGRETTSSAKKHIKKIETLVGGREDPARFDSFFLSGASSFEIDL